MKSNLEQHSAQTAISVNNISVIYNNGHSAIKNISFDISKGSITALVGVNGSGKSTLFKAIMGLYLGFCALWILGIFKLSYLRIALISNTIFMLGLGTGRVISFFLDGVPTFGYQFGTVAELFLGGYGIWILTNKNTNFAKK